MDFSFSTSIDPTLPIHSGAHVASAPLHVLIVGQIFIDTILTLDHYPEEDTKIRASDIQQRRGGNCVNTAEVLSQFPNANVFIMSAIGPKEESNALLAQLEQKGIKTTTCFHRQQPTPSCYIIQSKANDSRTIISNNSVEEISKNEFAEKLESVLQSIKYFSWVHFEGRNIQETEASIDWLEEKATKEGWRSQLTISVELEKPDRPYLDHLLLKGDVVFFSKLYAEKNGYDNSKDFLVDFQAKCKTGALLFNTWGEKGGSSIYKESINHAPAIKQMQVIDTVGAGDTFVAGIIYSTKKGYNLPKCLELSCEMASKKVSRFGFDKLCFN